MSQELDPQANVTRLLDAAATAIASTRYCWLITAAETGGARSRPMGRLSTDPGEDPWAPRLIADGRSRKVSDIRRDGGITLLSQHGGDAYVTLSGAATLRESASEVSQRWKSAYDALLRGGTDRANVAFIEVEAVNMELWIRGVTPEPFGFRSTMLRRDTSGVWRLAS